MPCATPTDPSPRQSACCSPPLQTITDMAYLQRISRHGDGEWLGHEKRMLDEWFAARFVGAAVK